MKNTDTREKILELLFVYPLKSFNLREISRLIDISVPSVSRFLKELETENLIFINKRKYLYEIKANIDNTKFKDLKRVFNFSSLYESGFVDYLREKFSLNTVILFGSYSKGYDSEKSDIDVAVIGNEKELNLEKFEKKLNRKINIEFIKMNKISNELKNSLINGIILNGYMEA